VAEDEGDALVFAQVGEPVPAEDALAADDEVAAEGLERLENGLRPARKIAVQGDLTRVVEHTEVESAAVEIDAAGERVGPGVKSHAVPPLACVSATLKATAWVAPEEACMSFNVSGVPSNPSFERTNTLRVFAAQLMIR
jgi:hypothetical protein